MRIIDANSRNITLIFCVAQINSTPSVRCGKLHVVAGTNVFEGIWLDFE